MKNLPRVLLLLIIGSLLLVSPGLSLSQQPAPQKTPAQDDDDVVRITTNLVQLDVVVTDNKGRQVTDLTADDFEMFEGGRPQKITNFSFVSNESSGSRLSPSTTTSGVAPAKGTRAEDQRRTIVIVIDDLKISFEGMTEARRAVKKFIDEGMSPGDLVAIVRTSTGVGALQQFTSDKRQLHAALERMRRAKETFMETLQRCQTGTNETLQPIGTFANPLTEFEGVREQSLFSGTLGAIRFILRGLREVAGRKALVIVSDGMVLCPDEELKLGTSIHDRLKRIADVANRSSVVVYHIDPRGLVTLDSAANARAANLSIASAALFNSQGSFNPLVQATGGFAVHNTNDISGALERVADDQKGYYLIGYRPREESFDSKKGVPRFNDTKIKVKRSGLTVRTRSGFYGIAETKDRPATRTRNEQLLAGLISPFSSGAIDVRLTSLFGNEPGRSFMLSLLHIDPAGLTFTTQPDGWQQAVVDVLAITFDADGQIVERVNRIQTLRARGKTLERLMKNGVVYSLSVPVKKPGGYQLRVAVRDGASERIGSASQYIEVPDLSKRRLALSGIALRESEAATVVDKPALQPSSIRSDREEIYSEPPGGTAQRRFQPSTAIEYDFVIYNASADAGQRQLRTQLVILRDGEQVYAEELKNFVSGNQPDLQRLKAAGMLLLGEKFLPGDYVLKITVVDTLAKREFATVTQTIDFQILK